MNLVSLFSLPNDLIPLIFEQTPIVDLIRVRSVCKKFCTFDFTQRAVNLKKNDVVQLNAQFARNGETSVRAIFKISNQSLCNLVYTAYLTYSYSLWQLPTFNTVHPFSQTGLVYPVAQLSTFLKANSRALILQGMIAEDYQKPNKRFEAATKFFSDKCEVQYTEWVKLLGIPCVEFFRNGSTDLGKIFSPFVDEYPVALYWMALAKLQVGEDTERALELIRQASEQKVAWAQFYLGNKYKAQKMALWTEAAQGGCVIAKFLLAELHHSLQHQEEYVSWLRSAAKDNCPEAKLNLSCILLQGSHDEQHYSLKILEEMAMEGNAKAQHLLANTYLLQKTKESWKKAIHWLRVSCTRNRNSQIQLITQLSGSDCTAEQHKEAYQTGIKARNVHGDAIAYYMLGDIYRKGIGIEKNTHKAYKCYLNALQLIPAQEWNPTNMTSKKCQQQLQELDQSGSPSMFPIVI